MNIRKINFIQAAGSLIALLMYLFLPIIRIVLLVGTGFSGETCMQVDDLFIIPVVLTGLALAVSFLPIGNISSFAGIAASLGLLIFGLTCKNALGDKVNLLVSQLAGGADINQLLSGLSGNMLSLTAGVSMMLRMGWGMMAAIAVMFISSIAGLLVHFDQGSSTPTPTYSSRSSVVRPDSTPTSHRSTSRPTNYHR